MLKFYVDYPLEDWLYRTHLHSMHIKAMNIPKLLSYDRSWLAGYT